MAIHEFEMCRSDLGVVGVAKSDCTGHGTNGIDFSNTYRQTFTSPAISMPGINDMVSARYTCKYVSNRINKVRGGRMRKILYTATKRYRDTFDIPIIYLNIFDCFGTKFSLIIIFVYLFINTQFYLGFT